jgi:hypothetical protein
MQRECLIDLAAFVDLSLSSIVNVTFAISLAPANRLTLVRTKSKQGGVL